jgi:hypothetical protein
MMSRRLPHNLASYALGALALAATLPTLAASPPAAAPTDTVEAKIARALSAGPANIAKDATVAEMGPHGAMTVLRKGSNDWTCVPGAPNGVGMPPMCEDSVAVQWNRDREEGKPAPTTKVPGIEYMLAGATQRSDSDPFDKTDPPIRIGPHWMILWPFDPKTSGLPTAHKASGAYIMYAGTPWAHVHVMGAP